MTEFEPFVISIAADGPRGAPLPAGAGAGLARRLAERLSAAGFEAASADYRLSGTLSIGAGWQAAIRIEGGGLPQPATRAESGGFDQPHHLLCRLFEFAALTLGVTVSEAVLRGFDDYRSGSPAAWLEWLAGHLMRAIELDRFFPAPRIELARGLAAQGEMEAAAGLLAGILVADPAAAAELGIAFWSAGQEQRAMQLLPAAVQGNPDDAVAAAALAALLARHGGDEARAEALLLATRATELGQNDYRTWAALADCHRLGGDYRQAGFFYGMALRLEPAAPGVLKDAAANWLLSRQPELALPLIERGLAATPADADHHGNQAFAHHLLRQHQPALAAARRAVELRPGDARLHVLHGDLAHAAGRREEALDAWARATELDAALMLHPEGGNLGVDLEVEA